jgi:1-acyl-sn-glycerol-3-phosphate acyltransferase
MSWKSFVTGVIFYPKVAWAIYKGYRKAKRHQFDAVAAAGTGTEIRRALESVGIAFEVTGEENLGRDRPVVYVANHMSVLETLVLPALLPTSPQPTFVVKKSLLSYPIFGKVLGALDPIIVERDSARADLATVLVEGEARLKRGMSVVVFPQAARSVVFDPAVFNTLGAKLAQRAGAPIVPLALKTDAWGIGRYVRDIGWIDPSRKVRFAFGRRVDAPRGDRQAHEAVVAFIQAKLAGWGVGTAPAVTKVAADGG